MKIDKEVLAIYKVYYKENQINHQASLGVVAQESPNI